MSEIFEALQKAQHEAETQRAQQRGVVEARETTAEGPPLKRVDGGRRPTPAREVRPHRNGRFRWLSRWLRGPSRNGTGVAPMEHALAPRLGTAIGEQFRVLRTRVETAGPATIMITSALDQEGKTLCATNLAAALALSLGAGVILIDADLRRPSIAKWFRLPKGSGLVDCLLNDARWEDCLQATEHERLRILPAGRSSVMSTELLGSDRMAQLLAELKLHFPAHYILVDAPPLLMTADSLVIARHVDHVLLVVRAGITPRQAVTKAIETLGPERFLGIVFNGATDNASNYYYYGRYPTGDESKSGE